jgi:aspartyl-tRNA(Asn)/glutamyl-tRNA(Gln) amidotransferase subunit B
MNKLKYEPVIGLEVHVELKTNSKMFCGCNADHFGKMPNTQTCPVCLGLPGALPVPNRKAVEWCLKIGLALNCKIPHFAKFDRKNYFYPDLPKGYQISQYDKPFCVNGRLKLDNGKEIRIRRVHMEEDTGKLQHAIVNGERVTLVDLNRSGVPLVEIVTEPDINSTAEAIEYLKKLQQIIRYLDVSNADMEKGSMRLEPNISIRKVRDRGLPQYKVEVKNINSFRFVGKAIEYELERQRLILERGDSVAQETRGFSETKSITLPQRRKEEANDYRYFPEPDIPPIRWVEEYIEAQRKTLPELPDKKNIRFKNQYGLENYVISQLTESKAIASYFEEAAKVGLRQGIVPLDIANRIINKRVDTNKTSPPQMIADILNSQKTKNMGEAILIPIIENTLQENSKAVSDYKSGKESALMFLIGQVMRRTQGRADAEKAKEMLIKRIK